jgi:soluble lytic murein transglycosylase
MFGLIALGGAVAAWQWQWRERDLERRYDELIDAAAARYGVDPLLVKAVIWRESRFRAEARGSKGEVGLMQIGALAAQEWAEAERVPHFNHASLFDPVRNTHAGAWYLAKMLRRYRDTDSPVHYALADYNAGRTQVLKWYEGAARTNSSRFLEQIGYPSTRRYVISIVERHRYYAGKR